MDELDFFSSLTVSCNYYLMLQKIRRAVLSFSSARDPTCVCLSGGSVTEIKTVPMEQMKASQLAAVSGPE